MTARATDAAISGVTVVIPAYDEEACIEDTVREAVEVLAQVPGEHEILVADDGSRDRTWEILERLRAELPMLRTLRHPENRGLAAAQKTLVTAARGRYIFHIGADGEFRMADLIPMLAALEAGHDICIGVRRDKDYSPWRKIASSSYNALVAILWGKHFGDLGSIKLARADIWKRVPFRARSAFVNAERVLIAYHNGARVTTVPVSHRARNAGESKYGSPMQSVYALRDLLAFRLSRASRRRL